MSDSIKKQFLTLLDSAINEASKVINNANQNGLSWLEDDVQVVKNNFENIKNQLIAGSLEKSEGAGLGITRALSEMEAPLDLYRAGKQVEDFYLEHW